MKGIKRTKPNKKKTEMCEAKGCAEKPKTVLGGYWFCDEHGNRDYEKRALSGKSQTTCSVDCALGDFGHCGRTKKELESHCEKRRNEGLPQRRRLTKDELFGKNVQT